MVVNVSVAVLVGRIDGLLELSRAQVVTRGLEALGDLLLVQVAGAVLVHGFKNNAL